MLPKTRSGRDFDPITRNYMKVKVWLCAKLFVFGCPCPAAVFFFFFKTKDTFDGFIEIPPHFSFFLLATIPTSHLLYVARVALTTVEHAAIKIKAT